LGETEVNDGLLAKAEHFAEIGDKVGKMTYWCEIGKKEYDILNKKFVY
jgi:hypothetical protein